MKLQISELMVAESLTELDRKQSRQISGGESNADAETGGTVIQNDGGNMQVSLKDPGRDLDFNITNINIYIGS